MPHLHGEYRGKLNPQSRHTKQRRQRRNAGRGDGPAGTISLIGHAFSTDYKCGDI